jgi:hypothetical protein
MLDYFSPREILINYSEIVISLSGCQAEHLPVEATNINRIVVKVGLRSLETIEKASKHLKLVYICFFSFLSRSVSHAATSRIIVKHCMVSVLTSSHQYAIA